MKNRFFILLNSFLLLLFCSACVPSSQVNDKHLPRLENAEKKYDFEKFDQVFYDCWAIPNHELHSLMILKDGQVVYENYGPDHSADELHILWSGSKTFTATAIGFAQQEGLLNVQDKVISFFKQEELPEKIDPWMAEMTIHDLLIMSSGLKTYRVKRTYNEQNRSWVKEILNGGMGFQPGSYFSYNSLNSYLLSAIVSRVSGLRMDEYLDSRLFQPLGIRKYQWSASPENVSTGGWGLYMTLESYAKMAQFLMQGGVWNGKQLLSKEWVDEALKVHIYQYDRAHASAEEIAQNDLLEGKCGYAYQMWHGTHGSIRLDGKNGQYSILFPEKNLVIAAFQITPRTELFFESLWKNVYPQF